MTIKTESQTMIKKVKHWRKKCKSYCSRTQVWLNRSETHNRTSGYPTLNNLKHSKNSLNTKNESNKTMLKMKPSEEKCKDSSSRIRVLARKSETPKRILDCQPIKYLSWIMNLTSTGLGTISSQKPTNRRYKNYFQRTTHLENRSGQHKRTYDCQPTLLVN
jgi:hypothetical protein